MIQPTLAESGVFTANHLTDTVPACWSISFIQEESRRVTESKVLEYVTRGKTGRISTLTVNQLLYLAHVLFVRVSL